MSSEEIMVQVKAESLLEENYTLLPYIKVEDENMMVLNGDAFKEDVSTEAVLCVPVADTLFDYNIDSSFIGQQTEEDFLNEHNYNTSTTDENNIMNMYWTNVPKKESTKLECNYCQKVMKTPGGFYRHLRIHTGEKPFQCQLCDKKFSQQSNLWKHVLIHTGERRFECPQCGKKFSQRANMQKHMMVHTGEKPFTCYVCSRTFTQRANLNKHIRIHTGEKPYSCKYCDRQFAQQSNMQKHELIHEGVRPFSCTLCSAAFTQQSNLKKHLEVHASNNRYKQDNPTYSCDACFKPYKSLDSLCKHVTMCTHVENANILIEVDENEDDSDAFFIDMDNENKQGLVVKDSQELWLQNVIVSKDLLITDATDDCT